MHIITICILLAIIKIQSACVVITSTEYYGITGYAFLPPTQHPLPKCDIPFLFEVADTNVDGAIDAMELRTFLYSYYQGYDKDNVVTNTFKFYKISITGGITLEKALSREVELIERLNLLQICS
jgi:hypothetical protein